MICTYCRAPYSALQSRGYKGNRHVYYCTNCGHFPSYVEDERENKSPAKILIFDIETTPLKAYVWQTGKQHVSIGQIFEKSFVLTWSARWLYDSKTMSDVVTPKEAINKDDSRVLGGIWDLLNEADFLLGHNINGFDIPKLNTRFLYNGFNPPSYSKTIDTYSICNSTFKLESNKLDYACQYFGLDHKVETGGLQLWIDCMAGNSKALDKMVYYNENDVLINEEIYLKIRPFIRNHPNVNLYGENDSQHCPACGSNVLLDAGYYHTNVSKFKSFRCARCGSLSRGRENIFDRKQLRTSLLGV